MSSKNRRFSASRGPLTALPESLQTFHDCLPHKLRKLGFRHQRDHLEVPRTPQPFELQTLGFRGTTNGPSDADNRRFLELLSDDEL